MERISILTIAMISETRMPEEIVSSPRMSILNSRMRNSSSVVLNCIPSSEKATDQPLPPLLREMRTGQSTSGAYFGSFPPDSYHFRNPKARKSTFAPASSSAVLPFLTRKRSTSSISVRSDQVRRRLFFSSTERSSDSTASDEGAGK